jgi:hypothetical protein
MPGSHAEEIVGDYFESDDWAEQLVADSEAEPDLDRPPLLTDSNPASAARKP